MLFEQAADRADCDVDAARHFAIGVSEIAHLRRSAIELRGKPRSYLSAGCPAPVGFPGAVFPLARASFGFADGRVLSATMQRSCSVSKTSR